MSRHIFDWEWYEDVNVFKLFVHLILECNYTDKHWQGININRGQLISGRKKLSIKTGLSEQEIRTAEKKLLSTNDIAKERINNYSLYTIVNYDKWQSNTDENKTIATNETTNNQPQLKKEKKVNKYTSITVKDKITGNRDLVESVCKDKNIDEDFFNKLIDNFIKWILSTKEDYENDTKLYKHFMNWIDKQKFNEVFKLKVELEWFIDVFNKTSNKEFHITETIKERFKIQFAVGYSGADFRKAIINLYSSSLNNSFHTKSSFKFATPEYLLKDDNLNKYLNFKT